jgi:hypothetical protein
MLFDVLNQPLLFWCDLIFVRDLAALLLATAAMALWFIGPTAAPRSLAEWSGKVHVASCLLIS